jgi:tRNA-splicing ligase RtcB (3'-phosphate/5'-hydroxy nucleic acid ligase)
VNTRISVKAVTPRPTDSCLGKGRERLTSAPHVGEDTVRPALNSKVQSLAEMTRPDDIVGNTANHFIELCLDTEDRVWLVLHSGSRGIGNKIAEVHIEKAKTLAHNQNLPDINLSVFLRGTPEMEAYWHDLKWAQRYASLNRDAMVSLIFDEMLHPFKHLQFIQHIWCHHNYAALETHYGEEVIVTRKGAIRAEAGQFGIIPGAMGGKTFIVKGKGCAEAFMSASHGAGRKMSRGQARRTFTEEDLKAQTNGVECDKSNAVLDEIPSAYKDIDKVMADQAELVDTVHTLKALLTVKGGDEKGGHKGDKRNKLQRGGVRE